MWNCGNVRRDTTVPRSVSTELNRDNVDDSIFGDCAK